MKRVTAVLALIVTVLLLCTGCGKTHRTSAQRAEARAAVAWAESRIGCPYVWGGVGPCSAGYDCSGLLMEAYAAAGVSIPRTSQDQFKGAQDDTGGGKIGDLAFYTGVLQPGESPPGHVIMIISARRHLAIEAYAVGTTIRVIYYDKPNAPPGETGPPMGIIDPTQGY